MTQTAINTHGYLMKNGRHAGDPITRVPISYLKWMINANHSEADVAAAELARRGTVTPDIDISGHAIDRASLNCRDIWHKTRAKDEGLHAWLVRVSKAALEEGVRQPNGKIAHLEMLFAFAEDGSWPVLKTIMRAHKSSKRKSDPADRDTIEQDYERAMGTEDIDENGL